MDGSNLGQLLGHGHLRPVTMRATLATNEANPLILDDEQVRVRSCELREAVSEPYTLVVTLCTDDLATDLDVLLGGACDLELERPGHSRRVVCGVIEQVDYVQTVRRRLVFRVHVVPAIALLRHSRRRRIFQDQSTVEIVRAVCGPILERYSRELVDDRLTREYPPRDYCVQMDESDLDFVRRILGEAGIWFVFDHDAGFERVVLLDDVAATAAVGGSPLDQRGEAAPVLPVISRRAEQAEQQSVQYFGRRRTVTPASYRQRAFDWKSSPPTVLETIELASEDDADPTRVGEEDVFASRRLFEADGSEGPHRDDTGLLASLAFDRGESRRVQAHGVANHIGIAAGSRFELTRHPHPDHDGPYVVLSVVHRAKVENAEPGPLAGPSYACEFVCQPAEQQVRPPRTRRPVVPGPHTAIVVGPAGEEVHTDALGRVRVRMHWDEERGVALPTVWMRVAQSWAGPGFGALFLPRVGMEVVVSFVDGDPDRPLVTGCLYNGQNAPPLPLPDSKTCSTLRTQSSPGGDGFNELRFEDAAGHEEIFLHAQRNLRERARSCRTVSVGANDELTVGKDQTIHVKGEQSISVDGRRDHTCFDDNLEIVNGTDAKDVHGTKTLMVTEEYVIDVAQRIVLRCGGTEIELTPTGIAIRTPVTYDVTVGPTTFAMNPVQLVAGAAAVQLHGATASLALDTEAALRSHVSTKAVCGESHVTLEPSAATVAAGAVTVEGGSLAQLVAAGVSKVSASAVQVVGGSTTQVDGAVSCNISGGGATAMLAGGVVSLNG
jgi:type VI secretion system secreted protein VgrG